MTLNSSPSTTTATTEEAKWNGSFNVRPSKSTGDCTEYPKHDPRTSVRSLPDNRLFPLKFIDFGWLTTWSWSQQAEILVNHYWFLSLFLQSCYQFFFKQEKNQYFFLVKNFLCKFCNFLQCFDNEICETNCLKWNQWNLTIFKIYLPKLERKSKLFCSFCRNQVIFGVKIFKVLWPIH